METVNALWIDGEFSLMEKLTMTSFVNKGHKFVLWTYGEDVQAPDKVIVKDASEIIPRDKVFSYVGGGDCRAGSFGGFSDLFRYHLLYQKGGWYVDMDVTCLQSFDTFKDIPYVFRPHYHCQACANIIKVPSGSELMRYCSEHGDRLITKDNTKWHLPIEIFFFGLREFELEKYIVDKSYFGNDLDYPERYAVPNYSGLQYGRRLTNIDSDSSHAVHWCNEWLKNHHRVDWNSPFPRTLYYQLLQENKLI